MASVKSSISVNDFPVEMVAAVAANAERDAECVGQFLNHLGLTATPEKPLSLPRGFLLHLGSALRLLIWEARGFFFHSEAGLPDARQAICDSFRLLSDPDGDATPFCIAVLRLSIERFGWSGPPELGADVALGEAEEELLLEALADFLWAQHRR
jgi:hypothetical protein